MKDLSQIIANLPPEKRTKLLQKLKSGQQNEIAAGTDVLLPEEEITGSDNFYMQIEKPGNLTSFKKKKQDKIFPANDQIQVKVKASSLNFRDLMIALNMYPATPGLPSVMGSDYSGIITEVGSGVSEFRVGDEVICLCAGSLTLQNVVDPSSHFAAYINISTNQATLKPKQISWEEAASIPTVFLTSYYSLIHIAHLKKGERVLIHTASGGVGQSALQIANWLGAEIFVTAGTNKKRAFLKTTGCKNPMDSRSLDFIEQIKTATNGEGIDVILNTIAGEAGIKGLQILRNMGRFVQIDKKDIASNNTIPLGEFNKGLTYSAFDLGLINSNSNLLKKLLDEISGHFTDTRFKPIPHNSYNINDLGLAFIELSRAQQIGKITLRYNS